MPQLDLLGAPSNYGLRSEYWFDPLHPDSFGSLSIEVLNDKHLPSDVLYSLIPDSVLHEAVEDLLTQTWQAYLFGEPGDVRAVFRTRMRQWRAEASHRPW